MKRASVVATSQVPPSSSPPGGRWQCCTQGWICHATGWTCVCSMPRAARSRSPPRRRMPTGCAGWPARPPPTGSRYGRRPGSMNGARFVHDQLELAGWPVAIADAQKVKGLAPLPARPTGSTPGCSPELSRRDLVPEIWLPTPGVRAERERARFRLPLVRHRTALKNRIHATLLAFGKPCPVSDPLWRRRPPAAGPADPARAVDRQRHRGPGPHRRPGPLHECRRDGVNCGP